MNFQFIVRKFPLLTVQKTNLGNPDLIKWYVCKAKERIRFTYLFRTTVIGTQFPSYLVKGESADPSIAF